MSWPTVLSDLRTVLADNVNDKLSYRKTVFGLANGVNLTFKTFDWRRVTNFTSGSAIAPLGVYVNGVIRTVGTDDVTSGEFVITGSPPTNVDTIEATYYYQWFLDSDLSTFVAQAVGWLNVGSTADSIPAGLQPAALSFASCKAYQSLIAKWSTNASNMYRAEDQPDQNRATPLAAWSKLASSYLTESTTLRDQYYRRSGQALQPLSSVVMGNVTPVGPSR